LSFFSGGGNVGGVVRVIGGQTESVADSP
jgi:hypothetical protein